MIFHRNFCGFIGIIINVASSKFSTYLAKEIYIFKFIIQDVIPLEDSINYGVFTTGIRINSSYLQSCTML